MELNGWIKLYRKLVDWEWFTDANTLQLFIYLLCTANNQAKNYRGVTIEAGQKMIGLNQLSKVLNMSIQSVRTSLNHLKSTNEITINPTNRFSIVTICNYAKYQCQIDDNQQSNQHTTQQSTNKQLTTNREIENKENIRNKETYINNSCSSVKQQPPQLEEINEEIRLKGYRCNGLDFYAYNEIRGWKIKNWKAALYRWQQKEKNQEQQTDKITSTDYSMDAYKAKMAKYDNPNAITFEQFQKSQQTKS